MTAHREHITGSGKAVDTAGYVVETTMALIVTVRGLIRDIITTLIADIIATMLIALALAVITFGASIPVAVGKCVATAAVQCSAMAAKLADVARFAARAAARLKQLATLTRNEPTPHSAPPATPPATPRPSSAAATGTAHEVPPPPPVSPAVTEAESLGIRAADEPFATWLAADRYYNGPPARTPTNEPAAPRPSAETAAERAPVPVVAEPRPIPVTRRSSSAQPNSLLRPWDIRPLKAHEEYFKKNYARYWDKNKYFENLVRTKYPTGSR